MLLFDQLNKGERPLQLLGWSVLAGLLTLVAGLWRVQILNGQKYRDTQQGQSFRTVRVPAVRGRIVANDGQVLADSRYRYRLDLYLDELTQDFEKEHTRLKRELLASRGIVAGPRPGFFSRLTARFRKTPIRPTLSPADLETLRRNARFSVVSNLTAQVSQRLGTNLLRSEESLYRHWYNRRYLPYPVLDNLSNTQIARIAEQGWSFPGLQLERVITRTYPEGSTAAHIVGHVGQVVEIDPDEPDYDYRLPDFQGQKGLEFRFDRDLRGEPGSKSILVNSLNYRVDEMLLSEPRPGQTIVTTLDLSLQKAAERALEQVGGDERGGVVVVDCRNGDILAMASAPTFDPNGFVTFWRGRSNEYARLQDPVMRPLINRTTDEIYAPGSTFKAFTALALMENGIPLAENFAVQGDPNRPGRGAYWLGARKIADTAAAGTYDFRTAFIKSSNSYFIDHALALGMKRFLEFGHQFHFGEPTGVKVGRDEKGLFPEYGQTLESNGQTWDSANKGVLADASIGQQITMTPLQLALAYAALANGGMLYWPRLVERIEPSELLSDLSQSDVRPAQIRAQLSFRRENLNRLHAAMNDDVADDRGTGKAARVPGYRICGKTGTAEIKGNGQEDKITWFASFAPYESPRYAVVVMVESGRSGGGTCAPVAQRIYQHLKQRDAARGIPMAEVQANSEVQRP